MIYVTKRYLYFESVFCKKYMPRMFIQGVLKELRVMVTISPRVEDSNEQTKQRLYCRFREGYFPSILVEIFFL